MRRSLSRPKRKSKVARPAAVWAMLSDSVARRSFSSSSLRSVMSLKVPMARSGIPSASLSTSARPASQRTAPEERSARYSAWNLESRVDGDAQRQHHRFEILGVDGCHPFLARQSVAAGGQADELEEELRAADVSGDEIQVKDAVAAGSLGKFQEFVRSVKGWIARERIAVNTGRGGGRQHAIGARRRVQVRQIHAFGRPGHARLSAY